MGAFLFDLGDLRPRVWLAVHGLLCFLIPQIVRLIKNIPLPHLPELQLPLKTGFKFGGKGPLDIFIVAIPATLPHHRLVAVEENRLILDDVRASFLEDFGDGNGIVEASG